jgi:hypothetical protein
MIALPKTAPHATPGIPETAPRPAGMLLPRGGIPPRPVLPPGVAPWLAGRRRTLTPTDAQAEVGQGGLTIVEDSWEARPLPADLIGPALRALAAFDRYLAPVTPEEEGWVLARVMTLLEHYAGRSRTPEVEEALALDWLEDIAEYPAWAIGDACRIWRRNPAHNWRPTPGQFRAVCNDLVFDARLQRDRLRQVLAAEPVAPDPEFEAREEFRRRWLHCFGEARKTVAELLTEKLT